MTVSYSVHEPCSCYWDSQYLEELLSPVQDSKQRSRRCFYDN